VGSATATYTLKILNNGTDYGSELDVQAIIDHAFYLAFNQLPDSSAVQSVTLPGGVSVNTGAPTPTPSASNNPGASAGATSWWSGLVSQIEAGSVGLLVGAAVVIGLLVYVSINKDIA
jgi:hypothetical protein